MNFQSCSDHSHVSHLSPSLVVAVRGIWVLHVVRRLHSQLGVIRVMSVELDLSLESGHVLSVDLESEGPEVTFPNETGLSILESEVVLLVDVG